MHLTELACLTYGKDKGQKKRFVQEQCIGCCTLSAQVSPSEVSHSRMPLWTPRVNKQACLIAKDTQSLAKLSTAIGPACIERGPSHVFDFANSAHTGSIKCRHRDGSMPCRQASTGCNCQRAPLLETILQKAECLLPSESCAVSSACHTSRSGLHK